MNRRWARPWSARESRAEEATISGSVDIRTDGGPTLKVTTSVLSLVAPESSFNSTNIKDIGWHGIKGIYIFQCIKKRCLTFKDCYGKVNVDMLEAVAGGILGRGSSRFTGIFILEQKKKWCEFILKCYVMCKEGVYE